MHDVLGLPGPGAGIALVLGPWVIFFSLLASELVRKPAIAFPSSLVFGLTVGILAFIGAPLEQKGKFGSLEFIGGMAVAGALLTATSHLARKLRSFVKAAVAGFVACAGLLAYFWTVIFPQTVGWIVFKDIPVLLVLGVVGGIAAGLLALAAARFLRHFFGNI